MPGDDSFGTRCSKTLLPLFMILCWFSFLLTMHIFREFQHRIEIASAQQTQMSCGKYAAQKENTSNLMDEN